MLLRPFDSTGMRSPEWPGGTSQPPRSPRHSGTGRRPIPPDGGRTGLVVLGQTAAGRRLKIVIEAADEQFVWTVADRDEEN